ncbi:Mut7-C RNAse domain-containing protein [Geodermatophilus maliterrae]|uniref:Mut7-C RNAse domain-containing protein n=1 Tax=Geodermatophilus maliterrae TaxID=3162531 RepID=A0ABV3XH10_9ACTN
MSAGGVVVAVDDALRPLLPARDRSAGRRVLPADPGTTVGHLVQAAGVPLTEAGELLVDGVPAGPADRPGPGATVEVRAVARPQPVPAGGFLLDVGLGALGRRMRLLGLDTAWSPEARAPDADDAELVAAARAEDRVLLTQDRGLLMRRALPAGAWVRGATPDEQLADVLDRFRPPLAPLTRCPACNGELTAVDAAAVAERLEPGTRRTATDFSRCPRCGRVYWRGAHARRIDALVARARRLSGR